MLPPMDSAPPQPGRGADADAVGAAASALLATLGVARSLVAAGRRVDLAGLDREAAALCAAALVLPRDQARLLLPALTAIEGEVAALMECLPRPA